MTSNTLRLSWITALVLASSLSAREDLSGFSNFIGDFKSTIQFETRGRDSVQAAGECRWDFAEAADGVPLKKIRWEWEEPFPIRRLVLASAVNRGWVAQATLDTVSCSNLTGTTEKGETCLEGSLPNGDGLRLLLQGLHGERVVIRAERRTGTGGPWLKWFRLGMTRVGSPVASDNPSGQECLITGGLGTRSVTFQGKTYYVCCGGCLEQFNRDPAKAVKEFEDRAKGKK